MTAIINNNGDIQLNVPYENINDLIAYGLSDWHFATDEEVQTYRIQQETAQNNASILAQIAEIEAKQARALRDSIIRNDSTYLEQYDQQIANLRSQLIR